MTYQNNLFSLDVLNDRSGTVKGGCLPPKTRGCCSGGRAARNLPSDDPSHERCGAYTCRHNIIGEISRIRVESNAVRALVARENFGYFDTCVLDVVHNESETPNHIDERNNSKKQDAVENDNHGFLVDRHISLLLGIDRNTGPNGRLPQIRAEALFKFRKGMLLNEEIDERMAGVADDFEYNRSNSESKKFRPPEKNEQRDVARMLQSGSDRESIAYELERPLSYVQKLINKIASEINEKTREEIIKLRKDGKTIPQIVKSCNVIQVLVFRILAMK